jgi:hypothetical protein
MRFYFVQDFEPFFYTAALHLDRRGDVPVRSAGHHEHARPGSGIRLAREPDGVIRARRRPRSLPPAHRRPPGRARAGTHLRWAASSRNAFARNAFGLGLASLAELKYRYRGRAEAAMRAHGA